MDDRTKLIADHVKRQVHNSSDSQCNSNPNPRHTQHHHCEHCYDYEPIRCRSTVVIASFAYAGPPAETAKPVGRDHFLLHGKRGNLLRTYPRTHPFLFHHTDFIPSLFILLQALHASLPPFSPFIPTRFLPLIAWSLLLSAFSLAFYFTTYVSLSHTYSLPLITSPYISSCFPPRSLPKKGLPLREIAVALITSLLGGFGTVAMFCTLGVYV